MDKIAKLTVLQQEYSACTKCKLCPTRTNVVFGIGNPNARILVLAEAPGKDEDEEGVPLIGASGRILDWILAKESGLPELQMLSTSFTTKKNFAWPDHRKAKQLLMQFIFYTNTVLCRPPDNRDPERDELKACRNRLMQTILTVDPTVIIATGAIANKVILGKVSVNILRSRGTIQDVEIEGGRVPVTYPVVSILHPAYLMRNVNLQKKDGAWKTTYRDIALTYDILRMHDKIRDGA
jgi:DNA polymerase